MDSLAAIVDLQDHVIAHLTPWAIICLGKSSRQWEKPCKDAALDILETAVEDFDRTVIRWWKECVKPHTHTDTYARHIPAAEATLTQARLTKSSKHLRELMTKNKHGDADVFRELKKKFKDAIRHEVWSLADPRYAGRLRFLPLSQTVPLEQLLEEEKRMIQDSHSYIHSAGVWLFDMRIAIEEQKSTIGCLVNFLHFRRRPTRLSGPREKLIHSIKPSTMIKYLRELLHTLPRPLANKLCQPLTPEGVL